MNLRNPFSEAREDDFYSSFDDMMAAVDPVTGETWRDYAIRTGMKAETLISMWERQVQGRAEAADRARTIEGRAAPCPRYQLA